MISTPEASAVPLWRIPFFHHPPFCKGPVHGDDGAVEKTLVDKYFNRSGVRVAVAGHEHLFEIVDHGQQIAHQIRSDGI